MIIGYLDPWGKGPFEVIDKGALKGSIRAPLRHL